MAGPKQSESSSQAVSEEMEQASAAREASAQVQETYLNSLKGQRESATTLQERYDKATTAYRDAIQSLHKELHDRSVEATQALAESIQSAVSPSQVHRSYAEAWKGFSDVLSDEASAAHKATEDHYRAFLAEAMQMTGLDDTRLNAAYGRYVEGLQTAWVTGPGPSRARQAYQALDTRLQELEQDARAGSSDAYQRYSETVKRVWAQPDVQGRWEATQKAYVDELSGIWKAAIENQKKISVDVLKGLQAALEKG